MYNELKSDVVVVGWGHKNEIDTNSTCGSKHTKIKSKMDTANLKFPDMQLFEDPCI